jgi:hypothetical protein
MRTGASPAGTAEPRMYPSRVKRTALNPLIAIALLVALPLAAGCGGDDGTAGSTVSTAATATTAVSPGCTSALEKADKEAARAEPGPAPELSRATIAALDACMPDEYIAAANAIYAEAAGVVFGPRDFMAMCDGNRTADGEWPAGCAEVATLTEPRWTEACAAYMAVWDNDEPSVCEARKT